MAYTWRPLRLAVILCLSCAFAARASDELPRLDHIVHITAIDGILRFDWAELHPAGVQPMAVRGPEAKWRVRGTRATRGLTPGTLSLERPPTATRDADQYWFIGIIASSEQVLISGNRGGRVAHDTMLRLVQRKEGIHLVIAEARTGRTTSATGANLVELRATHPMLVREHLVPLLVQLAGEDLTLPGAADVYRVFEEVEPDQRSAQSLQRILPRLIAPDFAEREAATALLDQLGPGAVCAAMRINLDDLPPEAAMRLESFIARHTRRPDISPTTSRDDLLFLADCMEFDDPRLRAIARARIEQITGKPIPLLPVPTPREWSRAADVVRETATR